MRLKRYALVPAAFGVALLLAACGGGGDAVTTSNNTPPAQQSDVAVTVVDGAIEKAKVCLDKNLNNACDADEPAATTDATGKATLKVDAADVGKYPVIAEIGNDAVDADSGPVTTSYVMKAPADKASVVSPLTTLVQNTIANTGVTSDAAEASLRTQVGVGTSLFTDFTKGSDADARKMGTLARLVVTTVQAETQQLAAAVGTQAMDGKPIQLLDVQQVIQQKLLEALPAVVAKAGDARLANTTPANMGAILSTLAQELVASPTLGLSTTNLSTLVAVARGTDTTPDTTSTPTAGATMSALNFTDAKNWNRRVLSASVAQNTPDANGLVRFVDRRDRSSNGVLAVWSTGGDPTRQDDVHWNGSAWVNCPLNHENPQTPRDASGRSQYDYCDGLTKGVSVRSTIDVSGRAMNDVYQQLTGAGYKNLTISNAASALGSAVFPANSQVYFQISTPVSAAMAYIPNVANDLRDTQADVAAGGNTTACSNINASTPASSYTTLTTSITGFVGNRAGTPCVYQPGSIVITTTSGTTTVSSGSRNEWWSQSTADIGTIGNAPYGPTTIQTGYYTSNTPLRVAFGANQTTTYYACQQRSSDGSVRNCNAIGTGTYTVTTLGDAKVLALQNEPAQFSSLNYSRIFVERGGKVHYGYVNRLNPSNEARPNLTVINALATQLGMPTVDPATPLALTAASYQGDWIVTDMPPVDLYDGVTLRFFGNGAAPLCVNNFSGQPFTCTISVTPSTGAVTGTDGGGDALNFTLDFNTGAVSGTVTPPNSAPITHTGQRR